MDASRSTKANVEARPDGLSTSPLTRSRTRREVLKAAGIVASGTAALAWGHSSAAADSQQAAYAGPMLFYTSADLPALQTAVTTATLAPAWQQLVNTAEQFIDPTATAYADPALMEQWPTYRNTLQRWVEILGFCYQLTGDERYGSHGRLILTEMVQRLPADGPILSVDLNAGGGSVAASYAMGYDWLASGLTPEQHSAVQGAMTSLVDAILDNAATPGLWWRPYHNYMGFALGGAGLAARRLQLSGVAGADQWVTDCRLIIQEWFDQGIDSQGAGLEGTYYLLFGLTNAVRFLTSLGTSGATLLNHPNLVKAPHFFAMELLPGGAKQFDARNDATYTGLRSDSAISPIMLRLATAHGSGLARWLQDQLWPAGNSVFEIIWANSVSPLDPVAAGEPLAEHFVGRGLCVFRTGWRQESARQDLMFSIEAGPFYPKTHNQGDKGHFALYGYGHKWAIDSAYANNNDPGGRAQTVAHNCILIDGRGQGRSGAGIGTNGEVIFYQNTASYGYAVLDCTDAYRTNVDGNPPDNLPMLYAIRHALFVRPQGNAPTVNGSGFAPYAVIFDDIQQDDAEHDYLWQLLTNTSMTITTAGNTATFAPGTSTARMTVTMAGTTAPEYTVGTYSAPPPPGSPETVPRLRAKVRAINPRFVAVLAPRPGGVAQPAVTISQDATGVDLTVSWAARIDTIRIDRINGTIVPPPVVTVQTTG